jgi:hypothetical protein
MPSLLEEPDPETRKLLQAVADGYAILAAKNARFELSQRNWPFWEWVRYQLEQDGIDAEDIYARMPTWQHGYRFIRSQRGTNYPAATEPIALTVAGMFYARNPAMGKLVTAFMTALRLAAQQQSSSKPLPDQLFNIILPLAEFATTVSNISGAELSAEALAAVLNGEPVTWAGVNQNGGLWSWDLSRLRLRPYIGITDCEAYLIQLDKLIGVSDKPVSSQILPAMALPDALDRLDLAWRLVMKEPLTHVQRVSAAAKLSQPAISADEFESRCSALSDVLNGFNLPADGGKLNNMKAKLTELLGAHAGRALDAVDVLRDVVAVRTGQQHSAVVRAERARSSLGLSALGSDWAGQWEQVRVVTVRAFDTIREEISVLIR